MSRLQLYGHGYCSLCEEMHDRLLMLAPELGIVIERIDIHDDHELERRYGEEVPVLCAGPTEICRHRLDETALRRHLGRA